MRLSEYPLLNEKFLTETAFVNALSTEYALFDENYIDSSVISAFSTFMGTMGKLIYEYYKRDRIAYEDKDVFIERLNQTLCERINFYFQRRNIELFLGKNSDTSKYMLTSSMQTSSNETGVSGSSVVQSYANTPTGVATDDTGDSIALSVTESSGTHTLDVTEDAYANKYTNNQTKTNGLRKNDVEKGGTTTRSGSFKDALELFEDFRKYPSFVKSMLSDVSQHFIYVY